MRAFSLSRGVVPAAVTPAGVRTTAARVSTFARRSPIALPVRRVSSTPLRRRGRISTVTTAALPTEVDVFNFENVVCLASRAVLTETLHGDCVLCALSGSVRTTTGNPAVLAVHDRRAQAAADEESHEQLLCLLCAR